MQQIADTIANATSSMDFVQYFNHEGAPSFKRGLRERLLQVLSTNTLSDTFYVKKEQLAQETIGVIMEAREKDPRYLAQAIVWARQSGLMNFRKLF